MVWTGKINLWLLRKKVYVQPCPFTRLSHYFEQENSSRKYALTIKKKPTTPYGGIFHILNFPKIIKISPRKPIRNMNFINLPLYNLPPPLPQLCLPSAALAYGNWGREAHTTSLLASRRAICASLPKHQIRPLQADSASYEHEGHFGAQTFWLSIL